MSRRSSDEFPCPSRDFADGGDGRRTRARGIRLGLALFSLSASLWIGGAVQAADVYSAGHSDIRIGYDAGLDTWSFSVRCEGCILNGAATNADLDPSQVDILVPDTTETLAQTGAFIDDTATGVGAGEIYYKLPESETEATNEGAPFLGISREDVATGVFVGDEITFTLESVTYTGAGTGDYSLFSSNAGLGFPIPHFWMSTSDPGATVNGDDSVDFSVGGGAHGHFNMGFSEPGTYEVTYRAEGDLVASGTASGTGTYRYVVAPPAAVPGPGIWVALALGTSATLALRRGWGRGAR